MCPIFFNIYGIKENEEDFPTELLSFVPWGKLCQEINFKSPSNAIITRK